MKKISPLIFVLLFYIPFTFSMHACALLNEQASPTLAKAVDRYCAETPWALRQTVRGSINNLTTPGNSVAITCLGDKDLNNCKSCHNLQKPEINIHKSIKVEYGIPETEAILRAKLKWNKKYYRLPVKRIIYHKHTGFVIFYT